MNEVNTKSEPSNPHGGDVRAVMQRLGLADAPHIRSDFSVNINPLGMPPTVEHLLNRLDLRDRLAAYPEPYAETALYALACAHGVSPECLALGNGSTECFAWIVRVLQPTHPAWITPCYAGYAEVCTAEMHGGVGLSHKPSEQVADILNNPNPDLLFIASPNNPTGTLLDPDAVLAAAHARPERTLVLDEAFIDFVDDVVERTLIRDDLPRNLVVVKSLTKFFAIPGLRLGLACAHPETMARLRTVRLPWSVNVLAQQVARQLYDDDAYIRQSRAITAQLRATLCDGLVGVPFCRPEPGAANFIVVELSDGWTADKLQTALLPHGILIRSCANFAGLGPRWIRLAVRPIEEQQLLFAALNVVAGASSRKGSPPKKTPALMVVGTMSNSGKSVMAAALCRWLVRRGYDVAPFKAQNMALNSFVTVESGEMGRAQVVQARAAGLRPHTDMNPVLLKPTGERGSQVIVHGRPIANCTAREYYTRKALVQQAAHTAYDRLAARHGVIVLEGAGSPAEINLLDRDIVNLPMAAYADAGVILVADIDRGGVFAAIYGSLALLPVSLRKLVRGVVINKFRGDVSLLEPGIRRVEELTGVPVLGVLPYLRDLRIEEEDSLGLEQRTQPADPIVDIAVVRLPRISNYTDFLCLEDTPGVCVRYLEHPRDLGWPDLVILPGSKNTRADLKAIVAEGWGKALAAAVGHDIPILGICGGYQMLGRSIADPQGMEGLPGESTGLSLLPVDTVLAPDKELAQVEGSLHNVFDRPELVFTGYEIHAGVTRVAPEARRPIHLARRGAKSVDERKGCVTADGLVFGCYIHGLFDADAVRIALLNWLCQRKQIQPPVWQPWDNTTQAEFDRLADALDQHLDMPRLIEIAFKKR